MAGTHDTYNCEAWICVDPLAANPSHETSEGWRPTIPLHTCDLCNEQRAYKRDYSAARHLRQTHFGQQKERRNANGQTQKRKGRGSRQDWPTMKWLKSHGWLKGIQVGHAMREEVPDVDAEEGVPVFSNQDGVKKSFHHADERPMEALQWQIPLHTPFFGAGNVSSALDASHQSSIPTAKPAIATTMQHWPLNTPHYPQTPLSMQLPMQTPQATYSLGAEPVLATCSEEACDQDSESGTETIPDEELILNVSNIRRVVRLEGNWFAEVDYEESILTRKFFGQLLLSNVTLSRLAETTHYYQGHCRVQWRSETIPFVWAWPCSDYRNLVQLLDFLCPTQYAVEWYARDSAYVLPGSNERYHLCLGVCCQSCAMVFAFGAPPSCYN